MNRKLLSFLSGAALLSLSTFAAAMPPNFFMPALYGDGAVWGTKGTTSLPAPNPHNRQSYDGLFVIVNSNNPGVQFPVSEAAPGNPAYNGGRWITYTVMWTQEGFDALITVPILTSYEDLLLYKDWGYLAIAEGSPEGGPPPYFQCPMLPVL